MELARAGLGERCIAAAIDSTVALGGSRNSFTTICTVRGEVLHNHDYSNIMHQGDLLLIDSGAESDLHYASDITRTLPVGGLFASRQKDVYSLVLKAQQTAIGMAGPGVAYRDCHVAAVTCIASGLKDMGLLRGNVDDIVREGAHALFMPHGLGHMIGLDVHDMENLGEDHVGYDETCTRSPQFGLRSLRFARRLRTGFTVTVEPGCYFIPALMDKWKAEGICKDFINHDALEHFRDFGGIRIEDDILVTDSGCRILGRPIPKTPEGIEARMHARS
jgi:Xaa-Pro aminopeptidase